MITLAAAERMDCIFYFQQQWKGLLFSHRNTGNTCFGEKQQKMLGKTF